LRLAGGRLVEQLQADAHELLSVAVVRLETFAHDDQAIADVVAQVAGELRLAVEAPPPAAARKAARKQKRMGSPAPSSARGAPYNVSGEGSSSSAAKPKKWQGRIVVRPDPPPPAQLPASVDDDD